MLQILKTLFLLLILSCIFVNSSENPIRYGSNNDEIAVGIPITFPNGTNDKPITIPYIDIDGKPIDTNQKTEVRHNSNEIALNMNERNVAQNQLDVNNDAGNVAPVNNDAGNINQIGQDLRGQHLRVQQLQLQHLRGQHAGNVAPVNDDAGNINQIGQDLRGQHLRVQHLRPLRGPHLRGQQNELELERRRREDKTEDENFIENCGQGCYCLGLILDFTNCILPAYTFFDKGIILAYSRIAVMSGISLTSGDPTPARFIVSIPFIIANSILVTDSIRQLQTFSPDGEYSELQLSLYPNTDGERALMIVVPVIHFIAQTITDSRKITNPDWKPEKRNPWAVMLEAVMIISNFFLPAFFPSQLFWPTFGLAIVQFVFGNPLLLLIFNIFAYDQFRLSQVDEEQLEKSIILCVVWFVYICIVSYFKNNEEKPGNRI